MSILQAARAIVAGLWRTLRAAFLTLGIVGVVGLLGLAVSLPLWAFSSLRPRIYTWFALAVLGAGVVFLFARRVGRRAREAGGAAAWARQRLVPGLRGVGFGLLFVAAAYAALVFFARGSVALGALIAVAALIGGGYLRFVHRRGRDGR